MNYKKGSFGSVAIPVALLVIAIALIIGISLLSKEEKAGQQVVTVSPAPADVPSDINTTEPDRTPADSGAASSSEIVINPTDEPTQAPTNAPVSTDTGFACRSLDPDKPIIALSFDDGPSKYTDQILDVLEKYDVHATFFVVGEMANTHKEQILREVALGCEIGNHTYTHSLNMKKDSFDKYMAEVKQTSDLVEDICGIRPRLLRPTGGSYLRDKLPEIPYPIMLWSVDTEDWRSRDTDAVLKHVKEDTFDGAVILMHDLYKSTADAVEPAIKWLLEQGYQIGSLTELYTARGTTLEPGEVYRMNTPSGRLV